MTGIFDQFGKNFRRFPQDLSMYDDEYLRYCVERERVESELESTLHETDDSNEIISTTLNSTAATGLASWISTRIPAYGDLFSGHTLTVLRIKC